MTFIKTILTWFILWTWGYYFNIKLTSEILSRECINYDTKKLRRISLVYSVLSLIFILGIFKKKIYLGSNELVIVVISVIMLTIASIADLMIRRVPNYFLRLLLLVTILATRPADRLSSSLDALILYMILYIFYQISGGAIGGADVRILTILALGYGLYGGMLILIYAAWICLIYLVLSYSFKKRDSSQEIAFVPYIYLAYMVLVYSYKI